MKAARELKLRDEATYFYEMIGVSAVSSQSVEYSESLKRYYRRIIDSTLPFEQTVKKSGMAMPWAEASDIMANTMRIKKRLEYGG